ncbi:MAG TPA: amidohydrolase family protein [Longimicrobiales bacterium]|nr:amidohydrolase family protein [Longimicrobiales bacterium]
MRSATACAPLLLAAFLAGCGSAETYDVVIAGGRVMDPESGLDATMNVGIREGRIAAVTRDSLAGARILDARGLVVAPGFIDLHRHGHTERGYEAMVRDGVTTALELEIGTPHVAAWYAAREGGQLVSYGASVGHVGTRAIAMNDPEVGARGRTARQRATPAQIAETERLIRVGLVEGAVGIGVGAAYTPGASMEEITGIFAIAAQRGVAVFVHTRSGLAGLDSTLRAAREAGASLHIAHANSSGGSAVARFLEMIDAARAEGLDVTTEVYPYDASQSSIRSALFDGWESWDDARFRQYQWVRTGERLTRETFASYRALGGSVLIHSRTPELTRLAVTHRSVMFASDGDPGHPRAAGTYGRILGQYVREEGLLDLMDALGRMTIEPARRLEPFVPAMAGKGRIRVGADADLTVFDPETVIDRATYANPWLPSEGFRYVLVNGVPVVDGGELVEGVRPGRPIEGRARY